MSELSCYIMTHNSELHLEKVIQAVSKCSDEIVILDSGSKDQTEAIANKYNCRFEYNKFENFIAQRNHAASLCTYDYVLFVDSDEVITDAMIAEIIKIKKDNFISEGKKIEGYSLKRDWFLFDQPVHAFYPVQSPDYPLRIFDKNKVSFNQDSNLVHETPTGYKTHQKVEIGAINHYSCDSVDLLFGKLNQYTTLAAQDLLNKGKSVGWIPAFTHAIGAWFKWYIRKGGYKDGQVGVLLGFYAFLYTYLKYVKAKYLPKGT